MYGSSHLGQASSSAGSQARRKIAGSVVLADSAGFIPRFCSTLFERLASASADGQNLDMVEACYFEIYNERVRRERRRAMAQCE